MRRGILGIGAFAALPFLHLVAANPGSSIPYLRLIVYWMAAVGGLSLIVLGAGRFDRLLGSRTAAVLAIGMYGFGTLAVQMDGTLRLGPVLGLDGSIWVFLGVVVAGVLISRWKSARSAIAIFGVLLLLIGVTRVVGVGLFTTAQATTGEEATAWDVGVGATPNIYWFVLDGYGRADTLETLYGYPHQGQFLDDLSSLGFEVSDRAFAAYPMTYLSIASTMTGGYVATDGDSVHDEERFLDVIRDGGAVVDTLDDWGYSFILWPGDGFSGTACGRREDVCLRATSRIKEPEQALLRMTPLDSVIDRFGARAHFEHSDPLTAVDALEEVDIEGPVFALIHLINPHPPHFVAGADCDLQNVSFNLGATYGRQSYVDAVRCLNRRLIPALERIIEFDESAVIVVQGDHGPSWSLSFHTADLEQMSGAEVTARFGVLSAMRLPPRCPVPDRMSLVNTYRVVFDCLSADEVPLVEDRMWLANQTPGVVREITPLD